MQKLEGCHGARTEILATISVRATGVAKSWTSLNQFDEEGERNLAYVRNNPVNAGVGRGGGKRKKLKKGGGGLQRPVLFG